MTSAAIAAAIAFGVTGGAIAQVSEIRVVEAGGCSGDSIEVGYIKPFTEETGITVVRENLNPLGKLQAIG